MLDEMSAQQSEYQDVALEPAADRDRGRYGAVRKAVAEVFQIEAEDYAPQRGVVAVFMGRLFVESEVAYDRLDARLAPLNLLPLFREHQDGQMVQVVEGRFNPRPRPWWPNALLFFLTLLSLLYTGAGIALGDALLDHPERQLAEFWRGWPYALGIVLILGAHELGHYFAARRHGIPVTLPYFLPFPFGFFGTLGAFIQLRAPIRNRKAMLDVGVTGPLVGLIFAVPILLLGLLTAEVKALPTNSAYILEGNSILYSLSKFLVFGQILPDGRFDVFINQLTQAGWTGLFVTGLNLIPIGQLDGGHVLYTLIGDRARVLYWPAVLIMTVLAVAVSDAWFLWVMLLLFFGRAYATPLDMLTPLDSRRRWIALAALIVFVLVFVPNPLTLVEPPSLPPMELF
jgi:membrane-associated protease RseP (regulator of RpoE activity)